MTSKHIEKAKSALYHKARELAKQSGNEGDTPYKYFTAEMKEEDEELRCLSMIISCVCYGHEDSFYKEKEHRFGEYGLDYAERLGDRRAYELFIYQKEFMKRYATISHAVGTDCEGVSYNSISWDIY